MFMVISGELELSSTRAPKFNGLTWSDGAFVGEMPLLGMGCGHLRNRHIYTAQSVVETVREPGNRHMIACNSCAPTCSASVSAGHAICRPHGRRPDRMAVDLTHKCSIRS